MIEEIQTACGVLSPRAEKETRNICGVDYPVAGWITSAEGQTLPLVDIPMMSDERYEELTRQNAIENYTRKFGKAPECIEDALEYNRQLAEVIIQVGAEDKTA